MMRLKAFSLFLLLSINSLALWAQEYGVNDSVSRRRAVEYYYMEARSYFEQDSLDRCFEMLQHCHALDSSSASVMFDLSSFYAFLNNDSVAYSLLSKVVDSEPENSYYNRALVNYYLKVNNLQAAIKVYERQVNNGNAKSGTYQNLFSLYAEAGEHEKAIGMLERIEKLEGSNEEIAFHKIRQYMELGDSVKAVDAVLELIGSNPDDTRCWTLLGNTYSSLGNREKALAAFKKALLLKPDDGYALTSLAGLYAGDEDDSLYCDVIERLLRSENLETESRIKALLQYIEYKQHTDSARVMRLVKELVALPYDKAEIANVYAHYLVLVKASPDTIASAFERVLSLEPENLTAIVKLLGYAVERNDVGAVLRYADEALPYLPDKLEIYYYKGISCYLLERKEEAMAVYREGLEKREHNSDPELVSTVYSMLGDLYHELSMIDECMQAYDSALVYNSSNISALNNYAYYLSLEGRDLQRALDMSHRTLSVEPDNATYIDTYAWILFQLGRYEEAKVYAEKLISLDDENSKVIYSHCGDIFAKCGDIDNAVKYWIMARDAGDESKILNKKIKKRRYYKDAERKR